MQTQHTGRQQPRGRGSIRTRLLTLLLGLTIISILSVGILTVDSVQTVGTSAQQISSEALGSQAEEYLRQVTLGDAQRNDLILKKTQLDASVVAQYATTTFDQLDVRADSGIYWRPADHMFTAPDGQFMNGEDDISSVFVPNYVPVNDALMDQLALGAYLDFILAPTFENDPNSVAIYMGSTNDVTWYYPNISLGSLVPPDFKVSGRPWYLSAAPENNPDHKVIWSEIYPDATGKGLLVTAAAPVFSTEGKLLGVIGIDVTLDDITASVEETRLLGSGYSFLIDKTGHAIALPEQGYPDTLGRAAEPDEVGADLSQTTTAFAPVVEQMMSGASGFTQLNVAGRELFVAYAPLEVTGWSLANVVETNVVLQSLGTLQNELQNTTRALLVGRILPVGGGILALMILLGLVSANRIAAPIRKMAVAAEQIGEGQWDAPLPPTSNDEVGTLAQALSTMTRQLQDLMRGLEQQVAERTAALQRRSAQLEASAYVAREAAAIQDVDKLLGEAVNLVSNRFGFYHAGIFWLDDLREYAILRAASSSGGRRMLARQHRLKLGGIGIVPHVAETGEPRIALDVGQDATYFDNPDLPETRSEMALPLKLRGQVIGVLDVQSTEPGAFTDEDVAILLTLADQIALALENARLLEESRDRIREIDNLLGRYGREGWLQMARERTHWGFTYDGMEVTPHNGSAGQEAPQLEVPLKLKDEVVGRLGLSLDGREPTQEDLELVQTVAQQASLALENAWLYSENQRRTAREHLSSQITAQMRESLDVEEVLRTAVQQIREALGVPEVAIRLTPPQPIDGVLDKEARR